MMKTLLSYFDPVYIEIQKNLLTLKERKYFIKSSYIYKNYCRNNGIPFLFKPMHGENTKITNFDRHYTYFPAWAARIIQSYKPSKHIDISSVISFSSMLSAFIPTEFYDFRPAKLKLSNLVVGKADLCRLPFKSNTINSISCMHVIEHIGLGRYGDELDVLGDKKAMQELKRVLSKNGNLLIVVPVGKRAVYFNAHRVYEYMDIIKEFSDLHLVEFSLIKGHGNSGIIRNASPKLVENELFGCGCYWFKK